MTIFFDVWMNDGFVLASDMRVIVNNKPTYGHKIARSAASSRILCGIAAAGEFSDTCISFFHEAVAPSDTLRDIARRFAINWTRRYASSNDYSAVHIVGFETIRGTSQVIPQMWYWHNANDGTFISANQLNAELGTFSEQVPWNNHIPRKIQELTQVALPLTLQEEHDLVRGFLQTLQPIFTWNGDTTFWQSAAQAVGSAMQLLIPKGVMTTLSQAASAATICLDFLVRLSSLLPKSTIGSSPSGEFDVLILKPTNIEWVTHPEINTVF